MNLSTNSVEFQFRNFEYAFLHECLQQFFYKYFPEISTHACIEMSTGIPSETYPEHSKYTLRKSCKNFIKVFPHQFSLKVINLFYDIHQGFFEQFLHFLLQKVFQKFKNVSGTSSVRLQENHSKVEIFTWIPLEITTNIPSGIVSDISARISSKIHLKISPETFLELQVFLHKISARDSFKRNT